MQNNTLKTAFLIGIALGAGYVAVDSMASINETMQRIDNKNSLDIERKNYSYPVIEYVDTHGQDAETVIK